MFTVYVVEFPLVFCLHFNALLVAPRARVGGLAYRPVGPRHGLPVHPGPVVCFGSIQSDVRERKRTFRIDYLRLLFERGKEDRGLGKDIIVINMLRYVLEKCFS